MKVKNPKLIKIKINIPDELDELSVHQQIVYALQDYIDDKAVDPERWKIEINGSIWNP